ncbi:MAG: cell wall hydrolase [Clostridia bacterium]|nr:cell wall hydrolase [Clostridia bacterium]
MTIISKKNIMKLIAVMLILVFSLSLMSMTNQAVDVEFTKRELNYFTPISDKRVSAHPKISVSVGGVSLSESAYLINDTTYVPMRAAATISGATVTFDDKTRTAYARMSGLELSCSDGGYIVYANERPILTKTPAIILSDGRMYLPVRSLAKALGLTVTWQPPRSVALSGTVKPLTHARDYYKQDDLYWLSRIINAESRGEPLLGQIAVGNVVLNRKASRDFPNTVYGVIFDRKYGTQFSPTADGSIYKTPTYLSTVAAKICLEGISVSPDVLFFIEPTKANSAWIVKNRKYAFTVSNHYFFY